MNTTKKATYGGVEIVWKKNSLIGDKTF